MGTALTAASVSVFRGLTGPLPQARCSPILRKGRARGPEGGQVWDSRKPAGSGTPATPLLFTAAASPLQCSSQGLPGGREGVRKRQGVRIPGEPDLVMGEGHKMFGSI